MTWEIDDITDPEERLAWLRARGRADADLVIGQGAAGARKTYTGWMDASREENDTYFHAYRERMHASTLERKAAGIQLVRPDYRGPLTETDWWRGVVVLPREKPQRPDGDQDS